MTEQEIADFRKIFNAEDAVGRIEKRTATINGVEVTCWETGLIERPDGRKKEPTANFGAKDGRGYLKVFINKKHIYSHRAIYQAFHGDVPDGKQIDHIDGDKANNDISNLRLVTASENIRGFQAKRKGCFSRFRWVTKGFGKFKWSAHVDTSYLGCFHSEEEAAHAADAEALKLGYAHEALNFTV